MHDLLIGLAFLAMVLAPCLVASNSSGSIEDEPDFE
jgi:hypothetical protein